ncbi:MAG: type III pantothenate kinase [Bacteroidia bacterium]|nr:type III pantothenate kinase [Bacteroidia bacterium]
MLSVLALDAGNTRLKATWLIGDRLRTEAFDYTNPAAAHRIAEVSHAIGIQHVGLASVVDHELPLFRQLATLLPGTTFHYLGSTTPSWLVNAYLSPETLGVDRWLAVHGARWRVPTGRLLVIDLGTAITYDYLTADERYLGGAIAPGLRMRYHALHTYTARLPSLEPHPEGLPQLLGTTTHSSLASGVEVGLLHELRGMVAAFSGLEPGPLAVVLTGGDSNRFEKLLDSPIFASPHLVALGIAALVAFRVYGSAPLGPPPGWDSGV